MLALEAGEDRELVRGNPDGVRDVAEAFAGEVLDLGNRGHGDADGTLTRGQPGDVGGLGGLQVGPELDAELGRAADHSLAVALDARDVEDQRGRREVGEAHLVCRHMEWRLCVDTIERW